MFWNARKHTLYASRGRVLSEPGLERHVALFNRLRVSDMSGDETVHPIGRGPKIYRIVKALWQSAALGAFLHALDREYRALRRRKIGWIAIRIRVESAAHEPVDVPPPVGLWRNCYDEGWLQRITQEERDALEIIDEDYDFGTVPCEHAA